MPDTSLLLVSAWLPLTVVLSSTTGPPVTRSSLPLKATEPRLNNPPPAFDPHERLLPLTGEPSPAEGAADANAGAAGRPEHEWKSAGNRVRNRGATT